MNVQGDMSFSQLTRPGFVCLNRGRLYTKEDDLFHLSREYLHSVLNCGFSVELQDTDRLFVLILTY